jgi:hypothetical protein
MGSLPRRCAAAFCLLLVLSSLWIGSRIPPLLSPDEPAHLVRAYTLVSGEWLMHNPPGQSTSAWLDPALARFLRLRRQHNRVLTGRSPGPPPPPAALARADQAPLGGPGRDSLPAPGSAVYPPLVYLPHGLALGLARGLGLPAATAYGLARLLALLASAAVLLAAFCLSTPNPLQLALLALPMSLFQLASASLDGFSTSLAVLAISLHQALPAAAPRARHGMQLALVLVLLVLVPARLQLWPLLLLPLVSARRLQAAWAWWLSLGLVAAVGSWLVALSRLTVDLRRGGVSSEPLHTALHFVAHPEAFAAVLLRTLSSGEQLGFYGRSFIGVLGWLHLPLQPPQAYGLLASLLLLALLLTLAWAWPRPRPRLSRGRLLLALLALLASLSVFLLLLLAWTPDPTRALIIDGVQGRYFLVPALLLSVALAAPQPRLRCPSALLLTYGSGALVLAVSTLLSLRAL